MERIKQIYYEKCFEVEFVKSKGDGFQQLFEKVMRKAYPGDFIPCRPWGRDGDRKNDGYLFSKRTLFQVYAPNEMAKNEAVTKINEDFAGAKDYWRHYFDTWVFVHNTHDGRLPAHVIDTLLRLDEEHPGITVTQWGFEELILEFRKLDETTLESWFGICALNLNLIKQLDNTVTTADSLDKPAQLHDIFLHYLTREVQEYHEIGRLNSNGKVEKELIFATRIALLYCKNRLLVPPSSLKEVNYSQNILTQIIDATKFGLICLPDSTASYIEFEQKKYLNQYNTKINPVTAYQLSGSDISIKTFRYEDFGKWLQRSGSATRDIKKHWVEMFSEKNPVLPSIKNFIEYLYCHKKQGMRTNTFDKQLLQVPEHLGNLAFITDFVVDILPVSQISPNQIKRLRSFISRFYIESHLDEFDAVCINDFSTLDMNIFLPNGKPHISILNVRKSLFVLGLLPLFEVETENCRTTLSTDDVINIRMMTPVIINPFLNLLAKPIRYSKSTIEFQIYHLPKFLRDFEATTSGSISRQECLFNVITKIVCTCKNDDQTFYQENKSLKPSIFL